MALLLSPPLSHLAEADANRRPWDESDWVASDDRVRGGRSRSYLDCSADPPVASFHGHLDTTALGGAGFASQRSRDPRSWDVSGCRGLCLKFKDDGGGGDGKKYTLVLKDEVLPRRPDGRERGTVSWEYDFASRDAGAEPLFIPWKDFKPMYRGKPKPDARPLNVGDIRRVGIMMRSFFGQQEGPFRLEIQYIAAVESGDESELSIAETSTTRDV
ncbi:NADH:ubiquinone oxidoreductase complex I intermediate-associated protein 30 [Xylariaceae sp. FL0662B]|nr:NADH:ubiquinone oxidoreductase complex I intermediate-associated protein 30 [Xylariaceae sp. FL0662B]